MAEPVPEVPSPDESPALEALKSKIADPALPTLDLARALKAYQTAWPQSLRALVKKLGMPEKLSFISEVLGLLRLAVSEQAKIEGLILSRREIQELQPVEQRKTAVEQVEQGVEHSVEHVEQSVEHVEQSVEHVEQTVEHVEQTVEHQINPVEHINSSIARGTEGVDNPQNPFKHAKRSEGGGDSGDKSVGELLVSVLIGLVFVPAFLFCWLVKQRAYDDLCELEDRAYRRALQTGAWNVIRWVLVAILILFIALALPRIRQLIHWLRHPPVAATQTISPVPTPQTGGTVIQNGGAEKSSLARRKAGEGGGEGKSKAVPSSQPSPDASVGGRSQTSPPSATPLVTANDATQLMQAGLPQTGGIGSGRECLGYDCRQIRGARRPSKPACAARNIRWSKVPTPDHLRSILIQWDDQKAGDQTNLYAARFSQSQTFDRDGTLIRGHSISWWPPDQGEQVFLLYLTTVDSHGMESAPSDRFMVDLR